jgi:hypothetical protein
MDFSELKRVPLGDVATTIIQEGGAVVGGLAVAGVAGRQVENLVMGATPVTPTSTTFDKGKAWVANNGPKLLLYHLLRGKTGALEDVKKGAVTSVAFDTLMRLTNSGVNPASATVMGYQVLGHDHAIGAAGGADPATVQRLVQENATLRAQLNAQVGPMDPRLPPYVGGASAAIPPAERERKYAFMQPAIPGITKPPGTQGRQTKYGFAGEVAVMSSGGRPGAAYVQAGKMFGMQ